MGDPWTIPAACLEQLGGLKEGDPPVVYRRGSCAYSFHPLIHPRADNDEPWHPSIRLLLPASSPALLAVLARHVGLTVPAWSGLLWQAHGAGAWELVAAIPPGQYPGGLPDERTRRAIFRSRGRPAPTHGGPRRWPLWLCVPALEGVKDPAQALAVVFVEHARLGRVKDQDAAADPKGPEGVAWLERACGLPVWEVKEAGLAQGWCPLCEVWLPSDEVLRVEDRTEGPRLECEWCSYFEPEVTRG